MTRSWWRPDLLFFQVQSPSFCGVGRGARAQKSRLGSKLEICNNNNNNKHSWLRFDFVVFYSNGDILESLVFKAPYARLQTRTQLHGKFVKRTNLYLSPIKIFFFSTRKKKERRWCLECCFWADECSTTSFFLLSLHHLGIVYHT